MFGFVYAWSGEPERAQESFAHAIELAEVARREAPRDPWVHSDLALYFAKTGNAESSLERLRAALALAPGSAEILAAAAETHEILGQRDRAVELMLQAFEAGSGRGQLQRNPDLAGLAADPRITESP